MMLACEPPQDWAWTAHSSGGGGIQDGIVLSKAHCQKSLRKPSLASALRNIWDYSVSQSFGILP